MTARGRKKKTAGKKDASKARRPAASKEDAAKSAPAELAPASGTGGARAEDHAFEALLDYLKRNRGFDFTGYKRSTLIRRVSKRMHEVGIQEYPHYEDYLEVHPDEFAFLFNTILINVTAFFRDEAAWDYLASAVVPVILETKKRGEPIRVWSAGCASGEEAYTLVMVLAEAMGDTAFRRSVKVYATDIDEEALAAARRAVYPTRAVEVLPQELRDKYFDQQGTQYVFRSDLRRSVIFGRHDLVQDAPISRIDLLVCRNVLMYLNAETQSRVLARLHFGLSPRGFLFLGKAEMLLSHAELFSPVSLKQRVFEKAEDLGMRQRLAVMAEAGNSAARTQLDLQDRLLESALGAVPSAQLVIDASGALALANRAAQDLFRLAPSDLGRPLQDLEISYRPVELRSLIDRAYQEGRLVRVTDVEKTVRNGEPHHLDVEVAPLYDRQGVAIGVSISFLDRTERNRLRRQLDRTREELEHSNEELQSANEELETTNEELQSTNEELETTNEELQSGNEELETMNEELQSTNEELRTINDQLQVRTQQLHENQSLLAAILDSIPAAVVAVDRDFRILVWEEKMTDLWGLRFDEVRGQSLLQLDIGLPVEELRSAIEGCWRGDTNLPPLGIDAVNRRGAAIRCKVTCTPLRRETEIIGAILLIERTDGGGGARSLPPSSSGPGGSGGGAR